jgi:hypothetical protein
MDLEAVARVVVLRRGRPRVADFRLRQGEGGLSLFALVDEPGPDEILDAVRAAGKQGELALAVLSTAEIRALGLVLVRTPGGTPVEAVNRIHFRGTDTILAPRVVAPSVQRPGVILQ